MPLRHANLVRTVAYFADERHCYWVTEAVQGQPLSKLLAKTQRGKRALSTRQLITILCDVLRGLEHAHGALDGPWTVSSEVVEGAARTKVPIGHHILCPASVLVTYDGKVKLNGAGSYGSPLVSTGHVRGVAERLSYLAPECLRGDPIDRRSDVYSVGAILWEGAAGRPRAAGLTLQELIDMSLQGSGPELESECPEVSPALAAVVRRALATDPADRQESAEALRQELEGLLLSDGLRSERGSIFGFMCNHCCEEHAALQKLLAERAPQALDTPLEPDPVTDLESFGTDSRQVEASSTVMRVDAVGFSTEFAPAMTTGGDAMSAATSLAREMARSPLTMGSTGSSFMDRRLGRGLVYLSIAGAAALGVVWAWPSHRESLPSTSVQSLTPSAPAPPTTSTDERRKAAKPVATASNQADPSSLRPAEYGASDDGAAKEAKPPVSGSTPRSALDEGAEGVPHDREATVEARSGVRRARSRRLPVPSATLAASAGPTPARAPSPSPSAPGADSLDADDAATLSALAESSADRTGVDLRALKRRAPRAIDTQDPYSP